MYSVPAKVKVQAKKLIESFEKGELIREKDENEVENEEEKPIYPERNTLELAHPGTAKRRLMELEKLKREAEAREKPVVSSRKLSEEMYGDFAHDRMKGGSEGGWRGSRNGVEHERVEHHKVEHQKVEHPKVEHQRVEEIIDEHFHEVFTHEGKSSNDEMDKGGKRHVLVVTATGTGEESALDKGLDDSVIRVFKDDDHEVHVTDLSHYKDHPIDYSNERWRLMEAELVVFHFRPILHTVPAAILDWFQNVLVEQFAFDRRNGKTFDNGLLKGKRSLLLVTFSEEKAFFDGDSPLGDLSQYLWPIPNGILRYSGFSVLTPHLTFGLHKGSHETHANEATEAIVNRIRNVWHEKPLFHEHK